MKIDYDKLIAAFPEWVKQFEVVEPIPVPELGPIPDPEPEPEPEPEHKILNDYVDALYDAWYRDVAKDGSTVTEIYAIKGPNMPYVGLANPTIQRPYYLDGEIVFTNQPNANFKKLVRPNDKPFDFPEEVTMVFRKTEGTDFEALMSGWGNYYLGFSNDNIRAGNANGYLKEKAFPEYFKLSYIHARYEKDGIHIWLNGAYKGKIETTDISWRLGYGVGIETNSTDFNWKATMFIERGMEDDERQEYFRAVEAMYDIGSLPQNPYASDILLWKEDGRLVPTFKYNGKKAQGKVEYQWWKMVDGLAKQELISTDRTIPYQKGVKCCVKVYDVDGEGWMFVSGKYN
ncbi:hypothetical protein GCM10027051_31150 [Niabella terrae]